MRRQMTQRHAVAHVGDFTQFPTLDADIEQIAPAHGFLDETVAFTAIKSHTHAAFVGHTAT